MFSLNFIYLESHHELSVINCQNYLIIKVKFVIDGLKDLKSIGEF